MCKNPETKLGFRIIWRAARDGDLDLVRILIREGQDPNEQSQALRNTPLHLACKHGHFLIVRLLVELGADRNLLNKAGKTALICAEESLDQQLAKLNIGKRKPPTRFEKGTLLDRLNATVDFLYEKDGRNREAEKAADQAPAK